MGRGQQGNGIEIHRGKLRIRFTVSGKRYIEPLDLKATAPNIKAAWRIAVDVRDKIRLGVFDYAAVFPNSKNIPKQEPEEKALVPTLRKYAKIWVKTLTGAKSTLDGYRTSIDNFWLTVVIATEKDAETGEDKEIQLGDLAITAVRHTHIATAISVKAKAGVSGKTTNNHLIPIRKLFEAANADELIETSPVAKVRNRKHQKAPPDPFCEWRFETPAPAFHPMTKSGSFGISSKQKRANRRAPAQDSAWPLVESLFASWEATSPSTAKWAKAAPL